MANFPTSGSCPNCPYSGELSDLSLLSAVGVGLRTAVRGFFRPFSTTFRMASGDNCYNGTHWSCPKCGARLIECNSCHTINLDRTFVFGDQADCYNCGKRIV